MVRYDAVVRVGLQQLLHLLAGSNVLMPLQQHDRVLVAGGIMIRRQRERALEQDLGVVQHIELHADLGQQPHAFDMIAVGEQVLADHPFGIVDLAVGEHAECGGDLDRQARELRHLAGRVLGIRGWPVIRNSACSAFQLAGREGFRFTARRNAAMAGAAERVATWQWPRSWNKRL